MASSISGAKAQRKIMFPMMCDQLPCMNIAVRIVIQWWPETICAGIADHWVTKLSPFINSSTKTKAFTRMTKMVTTGMRAGRRDASLNGIKPPMFSSLQTKRVRDGPVYLSRCFERCHGSQRRRGLAHRQRQQQPGNATDDHAHADQGADRPGGTRRP